MALMVVTLSAVIEVSFGNQDMLVSGEMNAEALRMAQTLLEEEQQLARKDFKLVNPIAVTTNGPYDTSVTVEPWPGDPYTTKRVTAHVNWSDARHVTRGVALTTLVSNFVSASGADTCISALTGDWSAPQKTDYQLASGSLLPSGFLGNYPLSDIDASRGTLYVAVASTSAAARANFFVFDVNPSGMPVYVNSTDNNPSSIDGINAVQIAGIQAFVANAHDANFKTCKPGANCSQLQIFNLNTLSTPPVNFLIPTSTPPFVLGNMTSNNQAVGKSLFYKDGYVYLGLTKTASGPEFNIIDVHDPATPAWVGSFSVGASINAIYVRNNYAYLATDDSSRELIILDVGNPASPILALGTVINPGGLGFGRSLYGVGDTLYLGRTFANGAKELYLLDVADPSTNMSAPLGSLVIGSSVNALVVRDYLAFLVTSTTKRIHILNISNPASITPFAPALSLPGTGATLDCEQNVLYAGSNGTGTGFLSVITSGP